MQNCIPHNLPTLEFLLEELQITHKEAAKLLHVSPRTIHNWLHSHKEPYAVRLALFWLTSYGYNIIHTDAHNQAVLYAQLAKFYEDYIKKLEKEEKFSCIKKPLQAVNDAVFHRFDRDHNNT